MTMTMKPRSTAGGGCAAAAAGVLLSLVLIVSTCLVALSAGSPSSNNVKPINPLYRSQQKLRESYNTNNTWNATCSVKPNVTLAQMAGALNWTCQYSGIDCSPIEPGGEFFHPDTVEAHLNWAMNTYFWQHSGSDESCDFGGIAQLTCGTSNWDRIRGVDIGGWLVLEPWIVPSLFTQFENLPPNQTAVDEYSFCSILGQEAASQQLTAHWESWFTEEDAAQIAKLGLNTIRIPVGYWVFGDVPPFVGGIEQLDRGVQIAAQYNLAVLIDLHGAPGSQNGFDNSGRACGKCAGICPPAPVWAVTPEYINQTIDVLVRLATRYVDNDNVFGIELLNEPRWDTDLNTLYDFYTRAYYAIRAVAPDLTIVFHDSFRYNAWVGFMTPQQGFTNIIIDTHVYEAFSPSDIQNSESGHLTEACGYATMINYMQCMEQPVIAGEWSLATTDCAPWLLGFEQNATAPSLGVPCPHNDTNAFMVQYAANQINTFERGKGWIFWNFKTENQAQWSWFDAVAAGWLPEDVSNLPSYIVNACSST
eukprot:TRINITY_DN4992_c0_g1_i1.p1 TRINITY_DN4992_c0_g1~~TRINITY_DN4992_c0_g1_i1.p1  ORF type:complete len:552 (+),score=124.99 TRINITY_DN4992_c0_g1_i1:59-1657(+)